MPQNYKAKRHKIIKQNATKIENRVADLNLICIFAARY